MNGHVDRFGRALVTIACRSTSSRIDKPAEAWIDTGFDGDLVLPQSQVVALGLAQVGTVKAILADGREIALATYRCFVDWFGEETELEVVANDGAFPLLGVDLLLGAISRSAIALARFRLTDGV